MQNPKTNLTAAIAFIALFVFMAMGGCKKDNATANCSNGVMDANESGVDCGGSCNACAATQYRIKTEISSLGSSQEGQQYFYRPDGQIDSVASLFAPFDGSKFTYTGNQVVQTYAGRVVTFTLNSDGYGITRVTTDTNGVVVSTQTHSFDTDGHPNASQYTYANGNLVSVSSSPPTTYTYHLDKLNTITPENRGMKFLGADSKNVRSARIITYSATTTTTDTFIYQYDALSRITRVESGNNVTTYTYY